MTVTIVGDAGADSIKIGYAHEENPRIIPNLVAKNKKGEIYVGDAIDTECTNYSELFLKRPFEKGYLIDCDLQSKIYERIFGPQVLNIDKYGGPKEVELLLTEPPFNPVALRSDLVELVFEQFEIETFSLVSSSFLCFLAASFSNFQKSSTSGDVNTNVLENPFMKKQTALVIDSGFSFSNITPIIEGRRRLEGIKRVNIGGKTLTNYLKEIVSLRYFNVNEETYLMDKIKQRMCIVSHDFMNQIKNSKSSSSNLELRYVLPNYTTNTIGSVLMPDELPSKDDQVLVLKNERISVPELLFSPSDIGLDQVGIPEAACEAVEALKMKKRQSGQVFGGKKYLNPIQEQDLYETVLLVGGNTKIPGYVERVKQELRRIVPDIYNINVHVAEDPICCCWKGGSILAKHQSQEGLYQSIKIQRKEYQEVGKFKIVNDNLKQVL